MTTLAVKKGVRLPSPRAGLGARRKYPFEEIEIGDVFFVEGRTTRELSTYASLRGRHLGKKFTTQTIFMRRDLTTDEWEPCKEKDPGSKRGVAVTRTA